MEIVGRVQNGVVLLEREPQIPDGSVVTVLFPASRRTERTGLRRRVTLPLVRSKCPGTRQLTAERLAELLDNDDVSA